MSRIASRVSNLWAPVRNRILLASVAALLVGISVLAFWSALEEIDSVDDARAQLGLMTVRTQNEMDQQFAGVSAQLENVAANHADKLLDPPHCEEVAQLAAGGAAGADIWVVDPDGALRCSSGPQLPAAVRREAAELFSGAEQEVRTYAGQTYLLFPYRDGVLLHSLTPLISRSAVEGGVAAVVSRGVILARAPMNAEYIGKPLPAALAPVLAGDTFVTATGFDGVERLYHASPAIEGTDWQLLMGLPTETLFAGREASAVRSLVLGLGVVGIAALLGMMLYRGVDAPLRRLQAAASEAIGDRRAQVQVGAGAPREVKQLGSTINRLLGEAHADRERLQAILGTMPVFVFAADADGIVTQIEGRDLRRMDVGPDLLGRPIAPLSARYPGLQPLFAEAAAGHPASAQVEIEGLMYTVFVRPLLNGGWAGVAVDQSEQYRVKQRLAAAEARLRAVLDHLPGMAYTYEVLADGSRELRYLSPRSEELFGYTVDELMGNRRLSLIDPRDLARTQAERTRARRADTALATECRMVRKDGRSVWVSDTEAPPIQYEGRTLVHGIILEIEGRKRAELALAEERRRLQVLFSHAAVGVALVGQGGQLLVANEAFERLAGISIAHLRRITPRRWIHPEDWPRLSKMVRSLSEEASTGGVEVRTHPAMGRERWVRVTVSAISNAEEGQSEQWVIIGEDVTETRQMQIRLHQERQRLDQLLNSIGDAFYSLDADGRFSYVNDTACEWIGRSREELLGQSVWELFPPAEPWAGLLRRATTERIPGEVEMSGSNGRWFSYRAYPTTAGGVSVFFSETTAAHTAAEALRESEERYRHLIEVSPETIAVHSEGKIAYVNPAGLRMVGAQSLDEVIGTPALNWVDPRDRGKVIERIQQLQVDGSDGQIREERFIKLDGTPLTVEVTASTLVWEGKPAIQIVARDTSERRRLESQVRQAQKMEVVGRLAGGVAHDLNNLLTGLRGYNELLLETLPAETEAAEYATLVARAGERASGMTGQLLSFARQYPADPSVIDVNATIGAWAPMLRRLVGAKIEMVQELERDVPAVLIDEHQFEQAIFNLAVNARDAMPEGGRLTLRTGLSRPPRSGHNGAAPAEWVQICVIDTGVGMNEEDLSRAFEPFWTSKPPGEGTGLGLSTVYGTITQAGGLIEVDSTPGAGTTFTIWLPPTQMHAQMSQSEDPVRPTTPQTVGTVLLVDDDETVRHIAEVALQRGGYRVLTAGSAREALHIWSECDPRPDALISDVVMPETGGVELARQLLERQPDLRVLLISGYAEDAALPARIRAQGHAFLAKPFLPRELLLAISELLHPNNLGQNN